MKITLLIGLPGSGKTYLGYQMMENDNNINYLDDIDIMNHQIGYLMGFEHIVISDVELCNREYRNKAIRKLRRVSKINGYNYSIDRIYFENNLEKCLNNINYRNNNDSDFKIIKLAKKLSAIYNIPKRIITRNIWQKEKSITHDPKLDRGLLNASQFID